MTFILSKLKVTYIHQRLTNIYCKANVARNIIVTRTMASEEEKAQTAVYEKDQESIFDKIMSRKIPAKIIYEDDLCIAFNDVNPQAPIHFLVVPKKKIPQLDDATENDKDTLGELLLTAKKIAQSKLPNGYRLVINNGRDGCQSVFHLHVHILGGRRMHWPPG